MLHGRRSSGVVTAIVGAGVALTVVATVLLHTGADRTAFGTLLLFAPRRFVPLAWLLLAIALLWRHRRLALMAAAMSITSLLLFAGFERPKLRDRTEAGTLRVVSWNVDYASTLEPQLDEALARWQADVVLLQGCTASVGHELRLRASRSGDAPQLGEFCVLSRLPVLGIVVVTGPNPKHPQWPRPIAAAVTIVAAGDTLVLLSVHLHSPRRELASALRGDLAQLARTSARRAEQAAILSQRVRDRRWPLVIAGDFNTPPESVIYTRHFATLTNAFERTRWGFGYTMRAGLLHRLRIDHALVTDDLDVVGFATEPHWPTEHVPLLVDISRR